MFSVRLLLWTFAFVCVVALGVVVTMTLSQGVFQGKNQIIVTGKGSSPADVTVEAGTYYLKTFSTAYYAQIEITHIKGPDAKVCVVPYAGVITGAPKNLDEHSCMRYAELDKKTGNLSLNVKRGSYSLILKNDAWFGSAKVRYAVEGLDVRL